jgi:ribosomal protein S18 acetylase RimI-like enzyme
VVPPSLSVRPLTDADREWVTGALTRAWGAVTVARKGEPLDASALPGVVAEVDGARVGLAVLAVRGEECEVVAISTELEHSGVGRALMRACVEVARSSGCRRMWLTTTNDNIRAIAFYQRFGMDLCALHRHGVEASRRVKPTIPLRDSSGVPLVHELEFELLIR